MIGCVCCLSEQSNWAILQFTGLMTVRLELEKIYRCVCNSGKSGYSLPFFNTVTIRIRQGPGVCGLWIRVHCSIYVDIIWYR